MPAADQVRLFGIREIQGAHHKIVKALNCDVHAGPRRILIANPNRAESSTFCTNRSPFAWRNSTGGSCRHSDDYAVVNTVSRPEAGAGIGLMVGSGLNAD